MILRVGLTGGIASGKSTIAEMFARLGAIVLDADQLVAELYRPGHAGYRALVSVWGTDVVREDGEIDRARLAAIAFGGQAETLNNLIHPLVRAETIRRLLAFERAAEDRIIIVEATLLLESGGRDLYDRIIVVDVPETLQRLRGESRGMAPDDVGRRMEHQMTRQARLESADFVIDNSGTTAGSWTRTTEVYNQLESELAERKGLQLT